MAIVAEGIIEEEEVEAIREWFGETAKPKGTANGQVITEREMHRIAVKLTWIPSEPKFTTIFDESHASSTCRSGLLM